MKNEKIVAVVLAGGSGKRMNHPVQKQYILLENKPIIYYSLKAFQESEVSEIVLVVAKGEVDYCKKNIIEAYDLSKVTKIVEGGIERFESVHNALQAAKDADYVLIHDGARPFISSKIIRDSINGARKYRAVVVGMPSKDTVKIVNQDTFAAETPDRSKVWLVQTPQSFEFSLIKKAYEELISSGQTQGITDDAMVLERFANEQVKLIPGSYENIKITTPEDLLVAQAFGVDKKEIY